LKPVAINPLSRYHPDNIAKRRQKKKRYSCSQASATGDAQDRIQGR
jgi:hypothetical protein